MTLFKQVALVVSLVFLLIVVTTTVGDFDRSGSFLEGQLQTSAQDMATTLGIAISNSTSIDDVAGYETLFNAVFDSGYYSSIELVSPDGKIILKKARVLEIQGVPDWFISMVPLWPATGSSEVMQGWVPLGTLRLILHPGHVYASLYKNLESSLFWFVMLFSFGMIILWLLLHYLLKPLDLVKQQANAIHNNQFVHQSVIPRTVELRSVVEAMNNMVEKVHVIFDDQEKTLIRYQKLLYEDDLTGLGNRQYFMTELKRVQSEDTSFHGCMAVIKIHNLEYVHDHSGYEKSDAIVKVLADILKQDADSRDIGQCARLADDEFSLLIPTTSQSAVAQIESIFGRFKSKIDLVEMETETSLIAGVSSIHVGHDVGETLAESDFALTQAVAGGPYSVKEKLSTNIALPQGKMQWRSWLEQCITSDAFFLVHQKVLDTTGSVIHKEVFVRLKNNNGQIVPAGMFMPMANALDLGVDIDRVVFQLVKDLSGQTDNVPIALNLTVSVFSHADALVEFNQLLKYFQQSSSRLCVEASHTILEQYPAMCAEVAESVRQAGHSFGIDNLNLGRSIQMLQSVRPDYVKVNAKILYEMTVGEVPAVYQALRTLTKAMDIQLIAVGVDSQEIHDHLQKLGVGAMQGNLLGETEEFL
jgi:diguanylate cyclase (GGDEF)-like protein